MFALRNPHSNLPRRKRLEAAVAFESDGNIESAARHFEQVYAENVDFRDVARRVKAMLVVQ